MILSLQIAAAVMLLSAARIDAIWFSMPDSGTKCMSEEIQAHTVVVGDYQVIHNDHPDRNLTVSAKVNSLLSQSLAQYSMPIFLGVFQFINFFMIGLDFNVYLRSVILFF